MTDDTAKAITAAESHHDGLDRRRTTAETRDAIACELDYQLEDPGGWDISDELEARALRADAISRYARALESIDRVLATEKAAAGAPAGVDADGLIVKVWNEIQEAGYPTEISDIAVAAVGRGFGRDVEWPAGILFEECGVSTND